MSRAKPTAASTVAGLRAWVGEAFGGACPDFLEGADGGFDVVDLELA